MPVTATHVPTVPTTSHAWHWLPHAVLQHTESTQLPLAHSLPVVHVVPATFEHLPTDPAMVHA